jgi:23S rRNA (cytosine1962-C5)-methyltransferase
LLAQELAERAGRIDWGELALVEDAGDRQIGLSFFARWSRP